MVVSAVLIGCFTQQHGGVVSHEGGVCLCSCPHYCYYMSVYTLLYVCVCVCCRLRLYERVCMCARAWVSERESIVYLRARACWRDRTLFPYATIPCLFVCLFLFRCFLFPLFSHFASTLRNILTRFAWVVRSFTRLFLFIYSSSTIAFFKTFIYSPNRETVCAMIGASRLRKHNFNSNLNQDKILWNKIYFPDF